jgi:SAM-dependent methyltransferase
MNLSQKIQQSWKENAETWIDAIQKERIISRKITNQAIINAVLNHVHGSLLDMGCGEGWLCRELRQNGLETFGIDGNEILIKKAKTLSKSDEFERISYQELIAAFKGSGRSTTEGKFGNKKFSGAVFNFSLYEKEGLELLFQTVQKIIIPSGKIIIQTIHPFHLIKNGLAYKSQWIKNSWEGLDHDFKNGHPWYLRTFGEWSDLFYLCSFRLLKIYEPRNPDTQEPLSVIFILESIHQVK